MEYNNQIWKLKNIPSRTLQLGLVGFTISVGIAVYFYILGLSMSAIMIGCFSISIALILLLQFFSVIVAAHRVIIGAVCVLLITSAVVEGSSTGQYFYFFPLTVVVPIVIDNRKANHLEVACTFATIIVSFAVCFYLGHAVPSIERIAPPVATKIIYSNAASAILTTLLFAIAYIVYERKFINALNVIAQMQSHEIRKPVASIIGLLDVWKLEGYDYNKEIITMIETSVTELDEKIHSIVDKTLL